MGEKRGSIQAYRLNPGTLILNGDHSWTGLRRTFPDAVRIWVLHVGMKTRAGRSRVRLAQHMCNRSSAPLNVAKAPISTLQCIYKQTCENRRRRPDANGRRRRNKNVHRISNAHSLDGSRVVRHWHCRYRVQRKNRRVRLDS